MFLAIIDPLLYGSVPRRAPIDFPCIIAWPPGPYYGPPEYQSKGSGRQNYDRRGSCGPRAPHWPNSIWIWTGKSMRGVAEESTPGEMVADLPRAY